MTRDRSADTIRDARPGAGRRSARRRWPRAIAIGLAVLLLALGAVIAWTGTESALRVVLARAVDAAGGRLQVDGPSGSLWHGVSLERVRWHDSASATVEAEAVGIVPHWRALLGGTLRLHSVSARSMAVTLPASDGTPASPPASLAAPIALVLDEVAIGTLLVRDDGGEAPLEITGITASVEHDRSRWRIARAALQAAPGSLELAGEIGAHEPFPVSATATARGTVLADPVTVRAVLRGPLAALEVDADTALRGAALTAQLRIEPFVRQPLAALRGRIDALDPAAFAPASPSARLAVEIDARRPDGAADASVALPPLAGTLSIRNAQAGPIDANRVPVASLSARFALDGERADVDRLVVDGPAGRVTGSARVPLARALAEPARAAAWAGTDLSLATAALDPSRLHRAARAAALSGTVRLRPEDAALRLDAALADGDLALQAAARLAGDQLTLERARLQARDGLAEFGGRVQVAAPYAFDLDGRLERLDPSRFGDLPAGRLDGRWQARGAVEPRPTVDARIVLADSRLRDLPLSGRAAGAWDGARLHDVDTRVRWGATQLVLRGALGAAADRLAIEADAPRLAEIDPRLAGAASVQATLAGTLDAPAVAAVGTGRALAVNGAFSARRLRASVELAGTDALVTLLARAGVIDPEPRAGADAGGARAAPRTDARGRVPAGAAAPRPESAVPIAIAIDADGLAAGGLALDGARASLEGDAATHRLALRATRATPAIDLTLRADGGFEPGTAGRWRGRLVEAAQGRGLPVRLLAPAPLALAADTVEFGPAELQAGGTDGARLQLERLRWADGEAALLARISGVPVAWFDALSRGELPRTDARLPADVLRLGARIDLQGLPRDGGRLRGTTEVFRESGDLAVDLPDADGGSQRVQAGLQAARAVVTVGDDRLRARIEVRGSVLGTIDGTAEAPLAWAADSPLPRLDVPLQGRLDVDVPSLAFTRVAIGDAWRIDGRLRAALVLGGTLARPVVSGRIDGDRLVAEQRELGLRLTDGTLALAVRDNVVDIEALRFAAGDGEVTMTGTLRGDDRSEAVLRLARVRVPMGAGQRLTLSGEARATLGNNQLTLRGALRADEGVIELTAFDTPQVARDVVVVDDAARHRAQGMRRERDRDAGTRDPNGAAAPQRGFAVLADLAIDLGDRLRVFGAGLDARLAGRLQLTGRIPDAPRLAGTVRIVEGSYTAFGRKLEIERGTLVFSGPVDNPAIDIAAYRRFLPVEAGVQLTGTARVPQLALVSKPDVPEADKLSWLVLGTAADASRSGAESAALQAAAATLFARGNPNAPAPDFARTFGLDVLSIRTGQAGTTGEGGAATNSAQDSIVTLGKRLTDRLFISYEQSLRGLQNLVRLQYEITERLSARARAGTSNGLDLLWTLRYD